MTIAILDNPSNPNFPTFWHARGYGLFAANPLGEKVLPGDGKQDFDLTLEPGKSATFHYRVLILDGTAKPADIEKAYQAVRGTEEHRGALNAARRRNRQRRETPPGWGGPGPAYPALAVQKTIFAAS